MVGKRHEYEAMNACEHNLWWYKNLHFITLNAIRTKFGSKRNIRILDAGCGTGGLMVFLINQGYNNISGIDLSFDAIDFCRSKGLSAIQMDISLVATYLESETYDVIVCNDILCYFPSNLAQIDILKQFNLILKPHGLIILNLPTFKIFSGTHDIAVGIKKRFNLKHVKGILSQSDLALVSGNYWPFFLSPIILTIRIVQKLQNSISPTELALSDVKLPNKFLNNFLFQITIIESKLPFFRFFGSSLFLVATKKLR